MSKQHIALLHPFCQLPALFEIAIAAMQKVIFIFSYTVNIQCIITVNTEHFDIGQKPLCDWTQVKTKLSIRSGDQ